MPGLEVQSANKTTNNISSLLRHSNLFRMVTDLCHVVISSGRAPVATCRVFASSPGGVIGVWL